MSAENQKKLLDQAMAGDKSAMGELLQEFRPYLTVLAQRYMNPRMQGRLDAADIVQITFLEAQRDLGAFRGTDLASLLAWLRNILRNNVASAHQRHLYTQKRSARKEVTIQGEDSSAQPQLQDLVPSETTSPSQRMMKDEAAVVLAASLDRLPDTQREAIRLRYLEGYSLKDISEAMQKSEMACAGLLKRGLRTLRSIMMADGSGILPPQP